MRCTGNRTVGSNPTLSATKSAQAENSPPTDHANGADLSLSACLPVVERGLASALMSHVWLGFSAGPGGEYGSAKFPARRELAGNFAPITGFRAAFSGDKGPRIQCLLDLNSLVTEQGILMQRAGNVSRWSRESVSASQRIFCPFKGSFTVLEMKRADLVCQG